jgi:hypothetical protein
MPGPCGWMGNPIAGFPSLSPQLPVCQTLSPLLPPIIVPQLAGMAFGFRGDSEVFGLINAVSRLPRVGRE